MKISYEKARERILKGNWPKLVFSKEWLGRPQIKRYFKKVKKGKVSIDYWNDLIPTPLDISIPFDREIGGSSADATREFNSDVRQMV
jgi:hypothetical protein